MTKRILVTGASGFVGSNLVPVLREQDYNIDVLTRSKIDSLSAGDDNSYRGDIRQPNTLPDLSNNDVVIHLAGSVSISGSVESPVQTVKTNTNGTQNVLERARKDGVSKFIYLSSGSVYGEPEYLPIDERHPTNCLHPYAASKLSSEHIIEAYANSYGISAPVLRAFTMYGPNQQSDNLVPSVISQILEGSDEVTLGNLEPSRDFIHVLDVASAVVRMIEKPISGYEVFNVGSGKETTVREIVKQIIEAIGCEVKVQSEKNGRQSQIEISRMSADTTKLEGMGWQAEYGIRDGIEQTVSQFQQ